MQKVLPDWKELSWKISGCTLNEVAVSYTGVRKATVANEYRSHQLSRRIKLVPPTRGALHEYMKLSVLGSNSEHLGKSKKWFKLLGIMREIQLFLLLQVDANLKVSYHQHQLSKSWHQITHLP
jgi:hypothetical protein